MTTYSATSGSPVSGITLSAGDSIQVLNGGIAAADILGSGSTETVSAGGLASATTVNQGATQTVAAGGTASSTTLSGGTLVDSGTVAGLVNSGGTDIVFGVTSNSLLRGSYDTNETVSAGGVASNTSVGSGAYQNVSSGGLAVGTVVDAVGGTAYLGVGSGGSATGAVARNSASISIYLGGSATGITISSGGTLYVTGVASASQVSAGGSALIQAGGRSVSATLAGGAETVNGSATGDTVGSGATQLVQGTATGTVLLSGGTQELTIGTASATVVGSGGVIIANSGSVVSGAILSSGGYLVAVAGSTVRGTVSAGGSVVSTGVVAYQPGIGTTYFASSGGALTFAGGGMEYVLAGGTATGGTFGSGATQFASGGVTIGTVLSGGGEQVNSGSVASGTVVSAFGVLDVNSGGATIGATVGPNGTMVVATGATASGTTVFDGALNVSSGGSVSGTVLGGDGYYTGGVLQILYEATALNTSAGLYGTVVVYGGSLLGGSVGSGGTVSLIGGTETGIAVSSGGIMVLSAGNASGIVDAGTVTETGAVATGTTVLAGGLDTVFYGSSLSEIIGSGGVQTVQYGTASGTQVGAGGVQFVNNHQATVSGTVLGSGGVAIVSTSATISGAVLQAGGALVLLPGATAVGTVSSGGAVVTTGVVDYQPGLGATLHPTSDGPVTLANSALQDVLAGGTASGTTVKFGGTQSVFAGGVATASLVQGGVLNVHSGGLASGVVDNGTAYLDAGATGSAFTVGGTVNLSGTITGLSIGSGGTVTLLGAATTTATLIGAGGREVIYAGTVVSTTVGSSGTLSFANGGTGSFTVVSGGGTELVAAGSDTGATLLAGATQQVAGAGTVSAATVAAGAKQFVSQGGTAIGTLLASGGLQDVEYGGKATGTVVQGGATLSVGSGAATGATVQAGGVVLVDDGGTASGTVLLSGATMQLGAGGYGAGASVGTIISSGATEIVSSGFVASNTVVQSGGLLLLFGGTAVGTVSAGGQVLSGGVVDYLPGTGYLAQGASISGDLLGSGAIQYVLSGGVATATTLLGAQQIIETGGVADATTVSSGGFVQVSAGGLASGAVIQNGGIFGVFEGGLASGTQVSSGGAIGLFDTTASAADTTLASGAVFGIIDGVATGTVVQGGAAIAALGGTTIGSILSSGGVEGVASGAVASATVLLSGGTVATLPGGSIVATVSAGGLVASSGVFLYQVFSGATFFPTVAAGLNLAGGAEAFVLPGGTLSGGTVAGGFPLILANNASGTLPSAVEVEAGGIVLGTTFNSGGNLLNYGSASGVVIGSGATDEVALGGVELGAVLAGKDVVDSGGTATGAMVGGGGVLSAGYGSMVSNVTVGSGGTLAIETNTAPAGTRLLSGGKIDLTGFSYATGLSPTFDPSTDTVTLATEGFSASLQLVGDYTGEYFHASLDAIFGTNLSLDTTPCYCAGTLIAVEAGETPVQDLRIGDRVRTAGGALRPIRWIGRRSYDGAFARGNRAILPVTFRQGSLGGGLPRRDLCVSPLHALFLDGVLVPAEALIDGVTIVQATAVASIEYIHLELETHDILLAEGAPAESFVDDGSRGMFLNAAEFDRLYPDAPRAAPRYCAPRVEDGPQLLSIRQRLADLRPQPADPLQGFLDTAGHARLLGWARDPLDPSTPVRLRVVVNGTVRGEVFADEFRPDLVGAGFGDGRHGFVFDFPGGLPPGERHIVEVRRASDGQPLQDSPQTLAPLPYVRPAPAPGPARGPAHPLQGALDVATRDRIAGWAQEPGTDGPVPLEVTGNGQLLARVLANRPRPDLALAGIGDGRHSFDLDIPGGLSPLSRHVIEVRRESDGAALPGSPWVIEPASTFDPALEAAIGRAVAAQAGAPAGVQDRALSFLMAQADRLRQQRAAVDSAAVARHAARRHQRRFGPEASARPDAPPDPGRRALVIDARAPRPGHDAGSNAILSHMRALQGLGYAVSFAAADEMGEAQAGTPQPGLDPAPGVHRCAAPFYASVEEVLRRQAGCFDVVYLHRAGIAERYLGLARQHQPAARLVFAVADLHHLRLARQADIQRRPELAVESRRLKLVECTAAWQADAVVTHSDEEARLLREAVPGVRVHTVPWAVRPAASPARPGAGIGFVGHYGHAPNLDAAHFLVEQVMPLVWREDPTIEGHLLGSEPPAGVAALAGPRVHVPGHRPDLAAALSGLRLTVAPLRFGAGVKGKVLDSLAAGVPCVMTPVAAEGLALGPDLQALVATDPQGLAALILRVHHDDALHGAAALAGLELIRSRHAEACVQDALARALALPTADRATA